MDQSLWTIRVLVDEALAALSADFELLYSETPSPSIVPEKALRVFRYGAQIRRLLSDEHFSVDTSLIEAWASMKSFRRVDGDDDDPPPERNAECDFGDERRSNATRACTTDSDARLYRKVNGQTSRLCYMCRLLMDNANGLIVDTVLTRTSIIARRKVGLAVPERRRKRRGIMLARQGL